jgi:hypothetical protein
MKFNLFFAFIFCVPLLFSSIKTNGQGFNRPGFYTAIAAEKLADINQELITVKESSIEEKEAYEGALLMKKAAFMKTPKEKLSIFKSGRAKLEACIAKDNNNIEYRFLRLIIQENAPKILKYKNDLEQDSQLLKANFKNLPQYLQQVLTDYSKKSKVLKLS